MILRDAYQQGRYVLTHVDVARRAEAVGFVTKGEKIWYQAGAQAAPLRVPFAYIPNITHQYIVIFQKPKSGECRAVTGRFRARPESGQGAGGAAPAGHAGPRLAPAGDAMGPRSGSQLEFGRHLRQTQEFRTQALAISEDNLRWTARARFGTYKFFGFVAADGEGYAVLTPAGERFATSSARGRCSCASC